MFAADREILGTGLHRLSGALIEMIHAVAHAPVHRE
jgi:hypothetical protein